MTASPSQVDLRHKAHGSAERTLGYTLTLATVEAWEGLSFVFAVRLSTEERAALAWAVLRTLSEDHQEKVVETVAGGAGVPRAPLMAPMDDARWWAGIASRNELKAYCLASFEALPATDRAAFLNYVNRKEAA